jgi:hypothetical protein
MIQKDSAKRWARRLRACCAAQVATTVQIDIDTENYQQKTGPPSTSRLRKVVIVQVKATSNITQLERKQRRGQISTAPMSPQHNSTPSSKAVPLLVTSESFVVKVGELAERRTS